MRDESKKAYIEKLEAKLKEWTVEFDKLKEKAGSSEAKIKEEYYKKIEDLHPRIDDIKKRIQKLKGSSGETWEELKSGTDKAWHEMKGVFEKAASKFKH
jgi:phage host-nuclease inhibitor protein Gam